MWNPILCIDLSENIASCSFSEHSLRNSADSVADGPTDGRSDQAQSSSWKRRKAWFERGDPPLLHWSEISDTHGHEASGKFEKNAQNCPKHPNLDSQAMFEDPYYSEYTLARLAQARQNQLHLENPWATSTISQENPPPSTDSITKGL